MIAPPFTFGNAGRNILIGPAFVSLDTAVVRSVRFGARQRIEIRAEIYNLLNRTNPGLARELRRSSDVRHQRHRGAAAAWRSSRRAGRSEVAFVARRSSFRARRSVARRSPFVVWYRLPSEWLSGGIRFARSSPSAA